LTMLTVMARNIEKRSQRGRFIVGWRNRVSHKTSFNCCVETAITRNGRVVIVPTKKKRDAH
jgi:hypothetical protein